MLPQEVHGDKTPVMPMPVIISGSPLPVTQAVVAPPVTHLPVMVLAVATPSRWGLPPAPGRAVVSVRPAVPAWHLSPSPLPDTGDALTVWLQTAVSLFQGGGCSFSRKQAKRASPDWGLALAFDHSRRSAAATASSRRLPAHSITWLLMQ